MLKKKSKDDVYNVKHIWATSKVEVNPSIRMENPTPPVHMLAGARRVWLTSKRAVADEHTEPDRLAELSSPDGLLLVFFASASDKAKWTDYLNSFTI